MHFREIYQDKTYLILLIIIIALGIYFRVIDYTAEGYTGDSLNTLSAAVFSYYPHDYFPGLVSTEPPLGNQIIGLGCILSGEDFSGVSYVKPLFFPNRAALIGEAASKAEPYCFLPIYIFGILFLIVSIIFSFILFDKKPALFLTAFFSLTPNLIDFSRFMHVDIIFFFFTTLSLLFLYKFYTETKYSKKELIYLSLSLISTGLSIGVKFPGLAFIGLIALVFLEKYYKELIVLIKPFLKNLNLRIINKVDTEINKEKLIILIIVPLIIFIIAFLIPFEFSFKNFLDTHEILTKYNYPGIAERSINPMNILHSLKLFIFSTTPLDTILLIISSLILIKLIFKKSKSKLEKFILMLLILYLIVNIQLTVISNVFIHTIPFLFGIFFLMALIFSEHNPLFQVKRPLFLLLIIIYIISLFYINQTSIYYKVANPVYCLFDKEECNEFKDSWLLMLSVKPTAKKIDSLLKPGETFYPKDLHPIIYHYTEHNNDLLSYLFQVNFEKQTGNSPGINDYITYFHPENKTIRYLTMASEKLAQKTSEREIVPNDKIIKNKLRTEFKPNYIIKVKEIPTIYIYDLTNLTEK